MTNGGRVYLRCVGDRRRTRGQRRGVGAGASGARRRARRPAVVSARQGLRRCAHSRCARRHRHDGAASRSIEAEGLRLPELRVYAPNGTFVALTGDFCSMPRARFDELLVRAALRTGREASRAHDRRCAARARRTGDRRAFEVTVGRSRDSGTRDAARHRCERNGHERVRSSRAAQAKRRRGPGVLRRSRSTGIAISASLHRVREDALSGLRLDLSGTEPSVQRGRRHLLERARASLPSLRDLWTRFTSTFEPAAAIVRESAQVAEFRGAPLRTGLSGAASASLVSLAIGESAAMTYPGTGEGIGKAMESGLLAARMIIDRFASGDPATDVHAAYEAEFRKRHGRRYKAYAIGAGVLLSSVAGELPGLARERRPVRPARAPGARHRTRRRYDLVFNQGPHHVSLCLTPVLAGSASSAHDRLAANSL